MVIVNLFNCGIFHVQVWSMSSLVPRPSHHPVLIAYMQAIKTGWWEGLGTRLEYEMNRLWHTITM